MGNAPIVSIGIPFLNPGAFLEDAIRSIFAQTFDDWELILVNDGSTDGSIEIATRISDTRVRVIDDGKHMGLVPRLNQIIDLSRGKYIARMDADDLMHPRRLETQVAFLRTHPNVQVVDTGAFVLDKERKPVGVKKLRSSTLPNVIQTLKYRVVLHASVVARREWYLANRYDPMFPRAEDRELFVRALRTNVIAHISQPLFFHFLADNVRRDAFLLSYKSERKVLAKYGPGLVGIPLTTGLWMRSLIKSVVLIGLLKVGRDDLVTRKAYQPITASLAKEAENTLMKISEQAVPGW
jgi:glycosyltransferase involved in cell wall biosynthesis